MLTTVLRVALSAAVLSALAGATACGATIVQEGPTDAGAEAAPTVQPGDVDAGVAANDPLDPSYPTAHKAMPLVDFNGGPILQHVRIVTITFGNDSMRSRLETFGDTITQTPWWDAVSAGYCSPEGSSTCVGRGSSGGHVNITAAPPNQFTDSSNGADASLQDYIKGLVADGTLPAPTADTLYTFYFPPSVQITLDGAASCNEFGAYHNSTNVLAAPVPDAGAADAGTDAAPLDAGSAGATVEVAYAIIPRCEAQEAKTTVAASHEIIEAATDPYVGSNNIGWYMQDQLWGGLGGEVADLCTDPTGQGDSVIESGFVVQRSWNNANAKASHDPCVPIPAGQTYFNVSPQQTQFALAVGNTVTTTAVAFSDGPLADWDLEVQDLGQYVSGKNHLDVSVDKAKVHNGTKVTITVTLKSNPPQGYEPFMLVSSSGNTQHYWPMAVLKQ